MSDTLDMALPGNPDRTGPTAEADPRLIACADCGLVQLLPPPRANTVAECGRCLHAFDTPVRGSVDAALAWSVATLLLLLPAVFSPLMIVTTLGAQRSGWIPTGVQALWSDGFALLATIVLLFSMVIPFVYLGLLIWVLSQIRSSAPHASRAQPSRPVSGIPWAGRLFRWTTQLRPWVMVEVYLVGCCVAYSRLQSIGTVEVGIGGWCLMGATLALLLATAELNDRSVWDALPAGNDSAATLESDPNRRLAACETCELVLDAEGEHKPCPRCGARLRHRKPDTIRRTLALVLCGFLLYLPANLLPVLSIERFGRVQPNTILGGVRDLISAGLWPLAAIVFTASIVVPLMKLLGLSGMLLLTHRRSPRWLVGRTRLYRFIDLIGRWSNIDLFMVSILVALVRYGAVTTVRAQPGAIAFATVVVITMLASRCFDARVMWDAAGDRA